MAARSAAPCRVLKTPAIPHIAGYAAFAFLTVTRFIVRREKIHFNFKHRVRGG